MEAEAMRAPRFDLTLRGELRHWEPMAKHVSWRAGGPAEHCYIPADARDLATFLTALDAAEPVLMVGLGSNLLVRDGGFRGWVVMLHGALTRLSVEHRRHGFDPAPPGWENAALVYAEAGVATPKLARFAANLDLAGAEFLAGIPGTVGGALAMNAGCHGRETWDAVAQVLTVDRRGHLIKRSPAEFEVGYRHVAMRESVEEWFVAGWFRFAAGDGAAAREEIKRLLKRRIDTQPLQLPNAGSVFRNPPNDHAARLIESCGLKGLAVGGARVSEKHANFIVNAGAATAADIETLIDRVEDVVQQRTGVRLIREVRIVGEKA
jgi:UDP-N-acetylmuramate dehydrogenase